ncbi:MAG: error-prone DNA polymerase [Actinobacteria bacterium]|nr:error-prone DNA polymerase [Actinomycetota bacterium]
MGWNNPAIPWGELERTLSGRGPLRPAPPPASPPAPSLPPATARPPETLAATLGSRASAEQEPAAAFPYAELHAHSHFSFLDGASSPEALVAEAARLGLFGLAITDHDGFQGAARFAEAATEHPELATVFGTELSLGLDVPQLGVADPQGTHLLLLAQGVGGYHRLSSAITEGQLAGGHKGRPVYDLEELAAASGEEWVVLTGCRKGSVRRALANASNRADGERSARAALGHLTSLFGRDRVFVELTDHGHPGDDVMNDRLAALAHEEQLPTLATGGVHFATAAEAPLAEAVAAIRARRSLDELDPFLPANGAARLRSGAAMHRRFARHPAAVARTAPLAKELAFPLRTARPRLPKLQPPEGHTLMSWLRELAYQGAAERYRLPNPDITARLEKELALIEAKDFPGYFLIVRDIVQFARSRGILCQGRGSAANSAVCYVLGITAVDSIHYQLPFERFLSSMREEEPDIDVDFESDRREEVIQYVYATYGRRNAAQVANVISYRPKSAVRDAAKALGFSSGQQRAWTRGLERWSSLPDSAEQGGPVIPPDVLALAGQLMRAPRHLGIHSGGMVLTERPVGEVCPIEHARMPGRTVLQWDKDDCASMGLVKFDLLGLGMLSALQVTIEHAAEATGERWSLETLPRDEAGVYDMLCRADAIGVFQLESRAQLNTLPRLRPRCFYDLVVEIALIRPGPLQGGAIHPYLRRRAGTEAITYPHPSLKPVLERTLGVPLFQEQLMQMAMAVGGCTAEDADLLRRAMGSKRGVEKIERLRARLFAGMEANGIDPATAERIYAQIEAFAAFGFAESHSISFALLVYTSAWFKLHTPAAFLAGLLRSQPMGFYAPRTLVEDARRHGVEVRPADVQQSDVLAGLEKMVDREKPTGLDACIAFTQPPVPPFAPHAPDTSMQHRRDGAFAVRLGLAQVRGIDTVTADRIVRARRDGPFTDLADLARRADLDRVKLEALGSAGACAGLGIGRREALWSAGPAAENREQYLPGIAVHVQPPLLPVLTAAEQTALDLWSTGVVAGAHPLALLRDSLDARRITRSDRIVRARPGGVVTVAGLVTHRQRPGTAGGITFLTLEDESGTVNVVVFAGVWARYRLVARTSPALLIAGVLERTPEGVCNVIAHRFEPLAAPAAVASRDFH